MEANPFDQFDVSAPSPLPVNPFDQFDAAQAPLFNVDPHAGMTHDAPQPGVDIADVAKSAGIGLAHAGTNLVGMPADLTNLAVQGGNWAGRKALGLPSGAVSPIPGGKEDVQHAVEDVTGPFYEPQTKEGKVAEAATETGASMLMPGMGLKTAAKAAALGAGAGSLGELAHQANPDNPWIKPAITFGTTLAVPAAMGGVKAAVRPFTDAGQRELAGKIINEASGGVPLAPEAAPLADAQLSTGQATNNPGMLWLERSQQDKTGPARNALETQRTATNQAIRSGVDQIGDTSASAAAPGVMGNSLDTAQKAARGVESRAWQAIDPGNDALIDLKPIQDSVSNYVQTLPPAYRKFLPQDALDVIANHDPTASFGDYTALRSVLGGAKRQADAAGQANQSRIIGNVQKLVDTGLQPSATLSEDAVARFNDAKQASINYHSLFDQPNVRKSLSVDANGFDRVPESATADQFIKPLSSPGAPEAWNAYVSAIKQAPPPVQAQAMDAARSAFAQKFLDKIQSVNLDQAGDRVVQAGKITKFTDDYAHVINSPLFTDDQRTLIKAVNDTADMAARTSRTGASMGSDTFAKLSGDKFLDAMIGGMTAKALPAVAGAAGYKIGEMFGGHGAELGAAAGYTGATKLAKALYAAPREKVMDLVQQAIRDPDLATALQSSVRDRTAGSSYIRAYIANALARNLPGAVQPNDGAPEPRR